MAKKFANYDEASEALSSAKEELKVAREEKKTFLKDNNLSQKEDHSEDPKHGKKYKKFTEMVDKKVKERDEIEAWMKENKPKKERAARPVKYEYPEDVVTPEDKKKYRASQRAAKKKAEKGESDEATLKKSKDKKKSKEEVTEPTESSKKGKDKKKNKDKKKAETPVED